MGKAQLRKLACIGWMCMQRHITCNPVTSTELPMWTVHQLLICRAHALLLLLLHTAIAWRVAVRSIGSRLQRWRMEHLCPCACGQWSCGCRTPQAGTRCIFSCRSPAFSSTFALLRAAARPPMTVELVPGVSSSMLFKLNISCSFLQFAPKAVDIFWFCLSCCTSTAMQLTCHCSAGNVKLT